jgi:hypothetical protein
MDSYIAFPALVPLGLADSSAVGGNDIIDDTDERPPVLIVEVPDVDVYGAPCNDNESLGEVYEKILLDVQTDNVLMAMLDVVLNVCLAFQPETVDEYQAGNVDELSTSSVHGAPAA